MAKVVSVILFLLMLAGLRCVPAKPPCSEGGIPWNGHHPVTPPKKPLPGDGFNSTVLLLTDVNRDITQSMPGSLPHQGKDLPPRPVPKMPPSPSYYLSPPPPGPGVHVLPPPSSNVQPLPSPDFVPPPTPIVQPHSPVVRSPSSPPPVAKPSPSPGPVVQPFPPPVAKPPPSPVVLPPLSPTAPVAKPFSPPPPSPVVLPPSPGSPVSNESTQDKSTSVDPVTGKKVHKHKAGQHHDHIKGHTHLEKDLLRVRSFLNGSDSGIGKAAMIISNISALSPMVSNESLYNKTKEFDKTLMHKLEDAVTATRRQLNDIMTFLQQSNSALLKAWTIIQAENVSDHS